MNLLARRCFEDQTVANQVSSDASADNLVAWTVNIMQCSDNHLTIAIMPLSRQCHAAPRHSCDTSSMPCIVSGAIGDDALC